MGGRIKLAGNNFDESFYGGVINISALFDCMRYTNFLNILNVKIVISSFGIRFGIPKMSFYAFGAIFP